MVETTDAILAFIVAAIVAVLLVPLAERVARRVGAIDEPRERGLHDVPTPKLSGVAILLGVEVAGWVFLPMDGETRSILGGAALIALVGVVDDIFELSALAKIIGQAGAALVPVLGGVRVDVLTLPFVGGFELGWIAYPATALGIVAVVNVINLIDGVDGLAAGVCVIAALALAAIALSLDRNAAGVLAALTAGAALGFLRHGFPPASSFMGDTGSNLLGFLLATAAVQGSLKTNAVVALLLPMVVLAVPILDTGFVVAKRLKYRQPIYQADRSHFHHRMANIGFSQRRTLAYLYGWTAAMAALALALRFVPYSDDRGNFDFLWLTVVLSFLFGALAASIYVVYVLEILKLRRFRLWQVRRAQRVAGGPEPAPDEVDRGVARELETGSFPVVDPGRASFPPSEPMTTATSMGGAMDFEHDGYLILERFVDPALCDRIVGEAEAFYASRGVERERADRTMNLHHVSPAAREVLQRPETMEAVGAALDATPVFFQSIYFNTGSQQRAHSDHMFMSTEPDDQLLGFWLACEDVTEGSGELLDYPGSHRMGHQRIPERFAEQEGDLQRDIATRSDELNEKFGAHMAATGQSLMTAHFYESWSEDLHSRLEQEGFRQETFLPRKGDVLLWHAKLSHGGSPVTRPETTRRSLVAHYMSESLKRLYDMNWIDSRKPLKGRSVKRAATRGSADLHVKP